MLDIGDPLDRPELLIGVGGVLVGLGAVATAVMAFTAFEVLDARNRWETDFSYPDAGRDALRDYDTFYPLMIALAIQGPALLLTGGTLLGVGIKRKRIATFAVSPSYSGEGGGQRFGLSLRLRM